MICPGLIYYARMADTTNGKKIPKYTITEQWGYFPPMDEIRGRDGLISMNLVEKLKDGHNVPAMRLQAKNSLNFTGLKDYFQDGKLSGYAYGYPSEVETYGKNNRVNPFCRYKDCGYLFIVHTDGSDPECIVPTEIELLVLDGARVLIPAYCKQLVMGGFDETLKAVRAEAKKASAL